MWAYLDYSSLIFNDGWCSLVLQKFTPTHLNTLAKALHTPLHPLIRKQFLCKKWKPSYVVSFLPSDQPVVMSLEKNQQTKSKLSRRFHCQHWKTYAQKMCAFFGYDASGGLCGKSKFYGINDFMEWIGVNKSQVFSLITPLLPWSTGHRGHALPSS